MGIDDLHWGRKRHVKKEESVCKWTYKGSRACKGEGKGTAREIQEKPGEKPRNHCFQT